MRTGLHRLGPDQRDDFFRLHSPANGCGLCHCVAWWIPTWDGWGERTPEQNRDLRQHLFDAGEYDGYLLYRGGRPVAWAQVGPRDRLAKLVRAYDLRPEADTWAITCLLLAPTARGLGLARGLVEGVLADLPARQAAAVEAYPRSGEGHPAEEVWTGPERLFVSLGFRKVQDHPRRPRYRLELRPVGPARV